MMDDLAEQRARQRFRNLDAMRPGAVERAAEALGLPAPELRSMMDAPRTLPMPAIGALADAFAVDLSFLVRGTITLDGAALVAACAMALGPATFHLDPIKGGVEAGRDPDRFASDQVRHGWQVMIAAHLAEQIGALYVVHQLGDYAKGVEELP